MIEDTIGGGNKLTFMDGDGTTYIINDRAGTWANNAWFSSGWGWGGKDGVDNYGDYGFYGH
jgi:hypothetical protein